eukprot:5972845-Prymnesium_polylepis.1
MLYPSGQCTSHVHIRDRIGSALCGPAGRHMHAWRADSRQGSETQDGGSPARPGPRVAGWSSRHKHEFKIQSSRVSSRRLGG